MEREDTCSCRLVGACCTTVLRGVCGRGCGPVVAPGWAFWADPGVPCMCVGMGARGRLA